MKRIYLDHNATMPAPDGVLKAMRGLGGLGNPASIHEEGRRARALIEHARERVAAWAGVEPGGVVFTSGGTEANAMAVHAIARHAGTRGLPAHFASNAGAHPSVRENLEAIPGWGVAYYHPIARDEHDPQVDEALRSRVRRGVAGIFEMSAHNETGEIFSLGSAIEMARSCEAMIHIDAVQTAGRIPFDPVMREADAISISGHKIGGIMGAGALILPKALDFVPLVRGGGQEFGRRSGTPPLAAIVALGLALENKRSWEPCRRMAIQLRDTLRERIDAWQVELSRCETGLPGTVLLSFPEVDGAVFAAALDRNGIAASYGSACASGEQEPSRALLALGAPLELARSAIRFSFGPDNSSEEVAVAAERIATAYGQVREQLR